MCSPTRSPPLVPLDPDPTGKAWKAPDGVHPVRPAADVAAADGHGRALLIRRHRFIRHRGWEIPGGQVEPGEDPAEDGIHHIHRTDGAA
ncbi:NUDIX hydrolase [Actinomadura sp. BRA 177]|uniref:NUDIX hydrolase n=1 Tax=Actinomadura sp. BRA 177 TaxID=2745202 RepID=UPI001595AEE9|nr:NUDIX hydrolase [Actinomadura sp. BRA 177]NVI92090.1 NUDIX domain-containing protein [Actinomadura sp. BRA 177]